MSWLSDRMIQYLYRCQAGDGNEIILEFQASEDPPDEHADGGFIYKRIEMIPYKTNLTFKVQFERNGLVAYKYDTGNGKPRIVSATRENYEKNLGNMPSHKVRELKAQNRLSELSPSITTKGYKKAYDKAKGK